MNLNELNTTELVQAYSEIIKQFKKRGVIRTKNLLGDLGEYLAIEHFNNTAGMSNLQAAPAGTQNIDAISRNGDRYSIKATTGNLTGVFYGLEPKKAYDVSEIRKIHKKAYEHWTKEADERLELLFCEGKTITELSDIFERNDGAIRSRIKKLELREKYAS